MRLSFAKKSLHLRYKVAATRGKVTWANSLSKKTERPLLICIKIESKGIITKKKSILELLGNRLH